MALQLNGTTGYLEYGGTVTSAYPYTQVIYVAAPSPAATWAVAGQMSSALDNINFAQVSSFDGNKTIAVRVAGTGSAVVTKGTPPIISATTLLPFVCVFTSPNDLTVYYGSSTGVNGTVSGWTDVMSTFDRTVVGASHYNGAAATSFMAGSVAELHFYTGALSSTDVGTLVSASVLPESLTGWVDGWSLKDYSAGGTYASIGGSRTLTAVGGVTASGQPHPITRSAAAAPVAKSYLTLQAGKNASFY